MIQGWRAALETPELPFVYVELCTEYGAEQPKEADFWEDGQRSALRLPGVRVINFAKFAAADFVAAVGAHPGARGGDADGRALEGRAEERVHVVTNSHTDAVAAKITHLGKRDDGSSTLQWLADRDSGAAKSSSLFFIV